MLSVQGKDLIRFEFHKLIEEKVYPISAKLLKRLQEKYEDFPIHSTSTLRKEMKNVSEVFVLRQTIKKKNHHTALLFSLLSLVLLTSEHQK
jgi:superfamily II RNA helicase